MKIVHDSSNFGHLPDDATERVEGGRRHISPLLVITVGVVLVDLVALVCSLARA
jgi:hypothetical protein